MKQYLFSFVLVLIHAPLFSEAKIWRVSNVPGSGADFATLAEAAESASVNPGDTLHLEASSTNYPGATITKRLVILGPGYFLSETANEKTQWNKNVANIHGNLTFNAGSSGSVVSGISFSIQGSNSAIDLNDSLIIIERNYFDVRASIKIAANANSYADGTIIRQNFFLEFYSGMDCIISGDASGQAKNVLIHNNIIGGGINFKSNPDNLSAVFINNIFTLNNQKVESTNCVYQNNVFRASNFTTYLDGNVYYNNILGNKAIPVEGGNLQSVDLNAVYVNYNLGRAEPSEGFSSDGRFKLKEGSPASGHGELNGNVVDCGAFGGPAPYILSGMPSIPSIYQLTVPAQVNTGSATMNISVSAAGH